MSSSAPLVLVDGSSYLYRAFHALPPLNTKAGQPTGAVKGVANMLRRLQKDYPESPIVVVFDAKGKTFRDEIYPEYKAHRPPMPDDLRAQIEPLHNLIRAMGFPLLAIEGVEADDVIGTLAVNADGPVVISSGDKDMAQLVSERVSLLDTMKESFLNPEGVKEKFGIPPELIIDFLALMGDKADNIPGVPKVGEKTALGLLQGLGGLESIYAQIDQVATLSFRGAKTLGKKLLEHQASAFLSYQLATIKTDVELPESEPFTQPQPDQSTLLALCETLEFNRWADELRDGANAVESKPTPVVEKQYDVVLTEADFDQWLTALKSASIFAFDTETTSLNYMQAKVVGVSFAIEAGKAAYVPCGHDYEGAPQQLALDWVLEQLRPLLEDDSVAKVGQNLKYDRSVLLNHGIELKGIKEDTMLASYVLNATATRHDMDSLAKHYLGENTISYEDIAGKGAKQLTFNQIDLEQAGPYAAEDADITLRLHQCLSPQVEKEAGLSKIYRDVEMPLVPLLSTIERTGALVDAELLGEQSRELGERLAELESEAYDIAGEEFNLASPKQIGVILFEKLGIPVLKKTKQGAPSTAEAVLQELAMDYPLPRLLLEHRSLAKLKSTYTDKLPQMVNPDTGRIHTSYHQGVTATGRLSSSDPNLQNIPIRTSEGRRIRQAFIAPDGYRLIAADYSQIELRIMAHLSADKGLIAAFNEGKDVHQATAAEVFGVELEAVTGEQRRQAKAINFGLIYGMSAFGLAKQLNIGRQDAQEYINRYFDRYPGVAEYMDESRSVAAENGYVETLWGRRLYLPEINSRNGMRRQAAERAAINAPMQGTAADIIKQAMIRVHKALESFDARILMQVHDELVLEVSEGQLEEVSKLVQTEMSAAAELLVPLVVDVGVGANWDEAH